jgi:hypothetical protein
VEDIEHRTRYLRGKGDMRGWGETKKAPETNVARESCFRIKADDKLKPFID